MHSDEAALWRRADAIFGELLELPEGERRLALANLAPDPPLRHRVLDLLAANSEPGPLDREIDWPNIEDREPEGPPVPSLSGRRFGAYVLDEEIGRGGMAVVYRAHRADGSFAQDVAVKVLGTGLLPTSAAARFHREQEVLARLRHPHIATLLDGGVAGDGTPFLVMERIEGLPIDRFCATRELDRRQRVELLLQVCEAVAYAHRNLVVHRDLKPGNILVTANGDTRLLDFGIAKLIVPQGGASDPTMVRSRLLTPAYAAPEQVDGGASTTATDVFGLGRVLEKLLAGFALDGDLANIQARALHPEPERRYVDARALAEDLERWIEGRPVVATPDSWAYRARKWGRRHRAALAAAALVVAVGSAGLVAALLQARRAAHEARNAAAVNEFLTDLFEAHDPDEAGGDDPPASELFRRGAAKARTELASEPELQAALLHTIGGIQEERGLYDDAQGTLDEALRLRLALGGDSNLDVARIRDSLGNLQMQQGDLQAGIELKRQALATFARLRPPDDPERLLVVVGLAEVLAIAEAYAEARDLSREALDLMARSGDLAIDARAPAYQTLGMALQGLGDLAGAADALLRAVEIERAARGDSSMDLAIFLNDQGLVLLEAGRYGEAERVFAESLAIKRKLLGELHVQVAVAHTNLGFSLIYQEKFEEGAASHFAALQVARAIFSPPHVELVQAIGGAATALRSAGRLEQSLPLFEEALRISRSVDPGARAPNHPGHLAHYGALLLELDRLPEAEAALTEAIDIYETREGKGGFRIHAARARRGMARAALRRWTEAAKDFQGALPPLAETAQGWSSKEYALWQLRAAESFRESGREAEAALALAAVRGRFDAHADERWPEVARELERLEATQASVR